MDDKPFYTFSLDAMRRTDPAILERFSRYQFNIEAIVAEAGRLKLESQMRIELEKEFAQPSDEFIRLMAARVIPGGRFTAALREQVQPIILSSLAAYVRDRVNDRLTSALNVANPEPDSATNGGSSDELEEGVVTTDDEIAGFRIVQAIVARHISPDRVVMRDSKSYCAILLDDNNRKSLVRLHFNSPTTRYVGTFTGKAETKRQITALTDIYKLEAEIVSRMKELVGEG